MIEKIRFKLDWRKAILKAGLVKAVAKSDVGFIKKAIASHVDITVHDNFALRRAVYNNDLDMAEILLRAGANPNAASGHAICAAGRCNFSSMVQLLLDHGADPWVRRGYALIESAVWGQQASFACLITHLFNQDPLTKDDPHLIAATMQMLEERILAYDYGKYQPLELNAKQTSIALLHHHAKIANDRIASHPLPPVRPQERQDPAILNIPVPS